LLVEPPVAGLSTDADGLDAEGLASALLSKPAPDRP